MTYTSKALPALTALALILGTTALTAPAFASATEILKEDAQDGAQTGGNVPQVMTDIPLDDVKAPKQSGSWFSGWFGGSKPVEKMEVKEEEKPVQPQKSGGWSFFGWGSPAGENKEVALVGSSLPAVTPTPDPSLPGGTVDSTPDNPAGELAIFKAQLARYAQKKGRALEDLSQSILASGDDVNMLTQHLAQASLSDGIQFDDGGDVLRLVTDINNVAMPIHASLFYFVEHKNKRQLHKTWFSGLDIHNKLMDAPQKKFTFLKVAREEGESALALWQAK